MPRGASILALVVVLLLAAAPVAAGEEDELRLTVAGQSGQLSMDAFGTAGDVFVYGARIALAHGLTDALDVGVDVVYSTQTAATFHDPMVGGVFGDDLVVYADVHAIEAAATARYMLHVGSRFFRRVHPTVEARAGVVARRLSNPGVFTDAGSEVELLASEQTYHPFVGLSAGVTFRASRQLQLGILATSTFAANHRAMGLALELSWQRDSLF